MATYYLKSTGSNTAPYDTEEKAANSMWAIRAVEGFASTDTIILCDDVTDTTFEGAHYTKMCNMEAKAGLVTKPLYHYNVNGGPWFGGSAQADPVTFSMINFKCTNNAAQLINGEDVDVTFDKCIADQRGTGVFAHTGKFVECLLLNYGSADNPMLSQNSPTGNPISLEKCTVLNFAPNNGGSSLIIITNIDSYSRNNIYYNAASRVSGSIFFSGNNLINASTLSTNDLYYDEPNTLRSFIYINGVSSNGTNTLNADPLFAEEVTYTLSTSSPAIDAGIGGINMGWDQITQAPVVVPPKKTVTTLDDIPKIYTAWGMGRGHGFGFGKDDK